MPPSVVGVTEPAFSPTPPGPTPLDVARWLGRRANGQDSPPVDVRHLECLVCERFTDHVLGPTTEAKDGSVLVQWWTCAECREGHTLG